ncbi:MAG: ATP-binding protein [Bacteroidales bacterium]|nr:ATP-binding protein [Bacteroidales bacterium]
MADQNNITHFDISAAVIRQLGEELVTDEVTAIMELIKNSYDADADWVKVEVNTKDYLSNPNAFYQDSAKGYIKIEDNGFGMSDSDIWNSWMKISLSAKKKFREDGKVTPKGRTPIGEKGVGRLSTQRLGNRLELFTGKIDSDTKNHVAFDWNDFNDDIWLTSVPVHLGTFPKAKNEKGTVLVITNLKEPLRWEGSSWDRFRGQVSQMIFPYKEKRVFTVYLKLNGQNVDLDELNDSIRENAVSRYSFKVTEDKLFFEGEIKLQKINGSNSIENTAFYEKFILPDSGKDFFSYLTSSSHNKRYSIQNLEYSKLHGGFFSFKKEVNLRDLDKMAVLHDENKNEEVIAHPGNFNGEMDDFYFQTSKAIESVFDSFSEFKRIVQNQVGVRVFRDGFGIKPYGINGQDWLNLANLQTSGSSFYGLRPKNIIGFVSISARDNYNLKEKTDREGFMDNPYSRNFNRIMDYFIEQINNILEGTRRSYNEYKIKIAQQSTGVKDIKDSFKQLRDTSLSAKRLSQRATLIKENLKSIENEVSDLSENPTGQSIPGDNHEFTDRLQRLAKIIEEAQAMLEEVMSTLAETKKIDEHIEFLQPQIENLEQQLSEFAELAGLGLTSEALSHELLNIVDRIVLETDRIIKKTNSKDTLDKLSINIYIEYIKNATKSFRKQLSHISPSLKYVRESKELLGMTSFLDEIIDYYKERFSGKIQIVFVKPGQDYSIRINKGKITQVIDNIIINSEYWLKEKKSIESSFDPLITIELKEPFLRIFDNGKGVDPNVQDSLFQPFITTKPKRIGRGLGLFIVQQLLESSGCEILLLNETNQYNHRYIFQLNLSSVIEN